LAVGVIKRNGVPKFNKEYLQQIMINDNFQMVFYLTSVATAMSPNFILFSPLVLTGLIEGCESSKQLLEKNPRIPVLSYFKDKIYKGV
jgi:hypothetical protein